MKTLAITIIVILTGLSSFSQIKSSVDVDYDANRYCNNDQVNYQEPDVIKTETTGIIIKMYDLNLFMFSPVISNMVNEVRLKKEVADLMIKVDKEIQQEKNSEGVIIDSPLYKMDNAAGDETSYPFLLYNNV